MAPAICDTDAGAVALRAGDGAASLPRPMPWQVAQTSWRVMLSLACVPRMACQKSMLSAYSRSAPFSGASLGLLALPPRRKNCEKMSVNPPLPPVCRRSGGCRAGAGLLVKVIGKIEAAEIHVRPGGASAPAAPAPETVVRIEAYLIVHLALLGIAQDVVGFLHVLEALLGRLVARIQIGMIFARELPVRLADLIRGGVPWRRSSVS